MMVLVGARGFECLVRGGLDVVGCSGCRALGVSSCLGCCFRFWLLWCFGCVVVGCWFLWLLWIV